MKLILAIPMLSIMLHFHAQAQLCIEPSQIDPTVMCPGIYDPVCGCDGITYSNECNAFYYGGVTSWIYGECEPGCVDPSQIDPEALCPAVYNPVCGCDGTTYLNECYAINYGGVTEWVAGPCVNGINCLDLGNHDFGPCDFVMGYAYVNGVCSSFSGCSTIAEDGIDYANYIYETAQECAFACDNVQDCIDPDHIDPDGLCPAIYDPVCGCNGETYTNSCEAFYAGLTLWSAGPCELECIDPEQIDLNVNCPAIYAPVCGCDGVTYTNACHAINYGGVLQYVDGLCADSDDDGYADVIDCAPFNPFIYEGASCDDDNDATNNDAYNDCCECVGQDITCFPIGPCHYPMVENGECINYDISITDLEITELIYCDDNSYIAQLNVSINTPGLGGYLVYDNTWHSIQGQQTSLLVNVQNMPFVLQRRMNLEDISNCSINLPLPEVIICPNDCPADLNSDGIVSTDDLLIMLANYGLYCD